MPHVPLFVSDKFEGKSENGLYGDVIMEIDWSVGEVLKALKEQGIEDNTLVIFTSDNGPWLSYGPHAGSSLPLREGKGTALEGGVRTPCIMQWPGRIPAGVVQPTPAMTIDLFPTIARLINADLPEKIIDGKDIWPLMAGAPNAKSPHEAYYFYYKRNELHGVLYQDRWKMYLPHEYRSLEGRQGNGDGTPIAYNNRMQMGMELYDLENDISERHNVADAHPDVVAQIQKLADTMRQKLGDSLTGVEGSEVREPGRVK
jgi:arylsulfatase